MLGLKPAEVSHLFNGHFSRFSTDKLLGLLAALEQKVIIQISPRKQGEPFQEVAFACSWFMSARNSGWTFMGGFSEGSASWEPPGLRSEWTFTTMI